MAKLLYFGPMGLFAYQVLLAYNGKNPMSVYDAIPQSVVSELVLYVSVLQTVAF